MDCETQPKHFGCQLVHVLVYCCRIRQELTSGAWCPAEPVTRESFEYLEIDLGQLKVLTMVETQGRFVNGQVGQSVSKIQYT